MEGKQSDFLAEPGKNAICSSPCYMKMSFDTHTWCRFAQRKVVVLEETSSSLRHKDNISILMVSYAIHTFNSMVLIWIDIQSQSNGKKSKRKLEGPVINNHCFISWIELSWSEICLYLSHAANEIFPHLFCVSTSYSLFHLISLCSFSLPFPTHCLSPSRSRCHASKNTKDKDIAQYCLYIQHYEVCYTYNLTNKNPIDRKNEFDQIHLTFSFLVERFLLFMQHYTTFRISASFPRKNW